MVLKQIQDLLHDHDCVIIPDFGGLIAQYASAKIHPVKHTFTPPSKKIAFNEKLKQSDGLLISSLARHLRIPNPEAQKMVAEFVGNLQQDLSVNKQSELQGIGIFRYNAEQKLEFEYLETENYLSHSFGLPELVSRPIIPEEAAALRAVRQKIAAPQTGKKGLAARSKRVATVAATVLTGGLTVAMVYYVSLQTDYNLSSLNPVALFNQTSEKTVALEAEKPVVEKAADFDALPVTPESESVNAIEADAKKQEVTTIEETSIKTETPAKEVVTAAPAPEPKNAMVSPVKTAPAKAKEVIKVAVAKPEAVAVKPTPEKTSAPKTVAKTAEKPEVKKATLSTTGSTIKAETGRYFIISGGYSSMANAERSQKDLNAKGAASDIILPMKGSKLHRVSVAQFESMESATASLPELRKKYGNALWILNY